MSPIRIALIITLVIVAGYGVIEALPILSGPQLTLRTPINGTSTPNGFIRVSGHVARVTKLTLDGATLLSDNNGSFSRVLALAPGTSILTLTASDRFGHTVTDTRTIFFP